MDSLYFNHKSKTSNRNKVVFGVIVLIAVVGVVAALSSTSSDLKKFALQQYEIEEQEFQVFIAKYSKIYDSIDEFNARFKIFRENAAYTRVHNTLGKSYLLGITQFSDLTHAEFKALYTSNSYVPNDDKSGTIDTPVKALPSVVDWRDKGAVTSVKNQGSCGSCWAFSATGAVEGTWALANHTLVSLSEQELVDCSSDYGNHGCNGGTMDKAFKFIIKYGLATDLLYPYTGNTDKCDTLRKDKPEAKISNYTIVTPKSSSALMAAVATKPVSVAVEADQLAWQFYIGGIVASDCGTSLDHGVLIVGYDSNNKPPYWIVKNSWGASWGEKGYIRIAISNGDGVCGINMCASYPIA